MDDLEELNQYLEKLVERIKKNGIHTDIKVFTQSQLKALTQCQKNTDKLREYNKRAYQKNIQDENFKQNMRERSLKYYYERKSQRQI